MVSRIVLMLDGVCSGHWRIDTRGFWGPAEIRGLQDLLEGCLVHRSVVKATLRL